MSATHDVARLLALVPWLLARPGVTVTEAAETFGVSEQRLRDDLRQLDFCGLPGSRGGDLFEVLLVGDHVHLSMADELRRPLRLTPAEAVRMVLVLETATRLLDAELPALRSGLAKVRLAAGVPPTVTIDVDDPALALAPTLRRAIRERRRVTFGYRGRADDAHRERVVEPWAIRAEGTRLYVQGHDVAADDVRSFRLDRVRDLALLDDAATAPVPDDVPAPRYEPHPDDVVVAITLRPEGRWLAEVLEGEELVERDDGSMLLTVRTDAPRWIQTLVLQAAGAAAIHAPDPLRIELLDRVDTALARYPA